MKPVLISRQTARRFVLGRQGLWPGRRWKGKKGTAQALRVCEAVQLDPLQVVARGLIRFARFLEAVRAELAAIHPMRLRTGVKGVIRRESDLVLK